MRVGVEQAHRELDVEHAARAEADRRRPRRRSTGSSSPTDSVGLDQPSPCAAMHLAQARAADLLHPLAQPDHRERQRTAQRAPRLERLQAGHHVGLVVAGAAGVQARRRRARCRTGLWSSHRQPGPRRSACRSAAAGAGALEPAEQHRRAPRRLQHPELIEAPAGAARVSQAAMSATAAGPSAETDGMRQASRHSSTRRSAWLVDPRSNSDALARDPESACSKSPITEF